MSRENTAPPNIWCALSGVRFLLALVVAGTHLTAFSRVPLLLHFAQLSGLAAVIGFLCISGYSIAASVAERPKGFLQRRALRILPLYLLSVAAAGLCLLPWGAVKPPYIEAYTTPGLLPVVTNAAFLQCFTVPVIGTNTVLWTLSVEVFFYLSTPLLVRLSTGSITAIGIVSLGLYVAYGTEMRTYYGLLLGGAPVALLGWAWITGFVVYRMRNDAAAGMAIVVVCLVALSLNHQYLGRLWTISIAAVGVAFASSELALPRWVRRSASKLGDWSYPLYLFHLPVSLFLFGCGLKSGPLLLLSAIAVAAILDAAFDQPFKVAVKRWLAGAGRPRSACSRLV